MAEPAKKSAEAEAAAEAAPPKKSKKLLIIVIVAVLVLAGGGGGAFFWMKSHAAQPKAEAKKETKKAPAIFYPLEPPFVVNFQGEQQVRFLQVAVQVLTREPEVAEQLKQLDPMIKNDLLLLFGGQKYEELSTRAGKEKLQAQALAAVRAIIEKAGGKAESIEALYFTSFVMQ